MKAIIIGVALLGVMAVTACGSNSSSSMSTPTAPSASPSPAPGTGTTVSIVTGASTLTTNAFSPNPVAVSRGTTVRWVNSDNVSHTSTSDTGAWNSGAIAPGAAFSTTFQNAGSFPYHCTIHPGMVGMVTVQ